MKIFHSSIFRALCAIVVGVLILKYPQDGVTWLTMAVGELFLISGIVALIAYWYARQHSGDYVITDQKGRIISGGQPTFPIVGAGSVLLGLVLVIAPGKFVDGLMYVLGGIMILGGIQQLINLAVVRRLGKVSFAFWICPTLILLTGLYVILRPMETATLSLQILGWCSLLYGVTELINSLQIWRIRKIAEKTAQQKQNFGNETVAEEISSEINTDEQV
jgi:uncharacterized membrane protein HdeD (DUF308 family)